MTRSTNLLIIIEIVSGLVWTQGISRGPDASREEALCGCNIPPLSSCTGPQRALRIVRLSGVHSLLQWWVYDSDRRRGLFPDCFVHSLKLYNTIHVYAHRGSFNKKFTTLPVRRTRRQLR